jgi:hypothetical protein
MKISFIFATLQHFKPSVEKINNMMEELITYFQKEFLDDKKRVGRIDELVNNAIGSLVELENGKLPYLLTHQTSATEQREAEGASGVSAPVASIPTSYNIATVYRRKTYEKGDRYFGYSMSVA